MTSKNSRRKILILTLALAAGNIILGYNVHQSNRKLLDSQHWVQHSSDVVARSEKIGSQVREIENAVRAIVITDDDSFPQPIEQVRKNVFNGIAQLRLLTRDNRQQQLRLDTLATYVKKSLDFSLHIVLVKQQYGAERSIMQLMTRADHKLPGQIQKVIDAIQFEENKLLQQRELSYIERIKIFNLFSTLMYVVMTLLVVLLLVSIWKSLYANREKIKRAAELAIANTELLFQNLEKEKRAAELVIANTALLFQNHEKQKRADELLLANEELRFQSCEKEKRAAELVVANKELLYQNDEKEKRAAELVFANSELVSKREQREFDRMNLNALINNTSDLMWSIDSEFKLITSNRPFDKIMGNNKGGMKNPAYYESRLQMYRSLYERAFAGETFTEIKYSPLPEDNWSEISFQPIFKSGNVVGAACHSRDISSRKSAELIMEKQNAELLKTNHELDRFVYSVSHDLRSPLTSVLGLLSLIDDDTKEASTLEYSGLIRVSINRLDGFIRNILNYSRNIRTEVEPEKVNLKQNISAIVTALRHMQEAEGIIFETDIQVQADFYTDLQRFNTLIENLIANAIKYHKNERKNRFVKITGIADANELRLTIEDNGIGILPEYHEKIFGMFFRISGSISGSGIGLYIVKEIIDALDGTIEVRSDKGSGTSFLITLKNLNP